MCLSEVPLTNRSFAKLFLTVGQCLHCLRGLRGLSYISESFFSLSTSIWVLARAALSSSRSDVSMAICKQHGTSAERVSGRALEITGDAVSVSVRLVWREVTMGQ